MTGSQASTGFGIAFAVLLIAFVVFVVLAATPRFQTGRNMVIACVCGGGALLAFALGIAI